MKQQHTNANDKTSSTQLILLVCTQQQLIERAQFGLTDQTNSDNPSITLSTALPPANLWNTYLPSEFSSFGISLWLKEVPKYPPLTIPQQIEWSNTIWPVN